MIGLGHWTKLLPSSIYTLAISPDEKYGENNDFTLHIEETNQAIDGRDVKDVL